MAFHVKTLSCAERLRFVDGILLRPTFVLVAKVSIIPFVPAWFFGQLRLIIVEASPRYACPLSDLPACCRSFLLVVAFNLFGFKAIAPVKRIREGFFGDTFAGHFPIFKKALHLFYFRKFQGQLFLYQ